MKKDGKIKDPRVERIFNELQEKGLIDRDIKLMATEKIGNFKSSIGKKRILYNPKFSAYLDEDAIKFALLHEMGHKKTGVHNQATYAVFTAIIVIVWICVMIYFNLKFFIDLTKYIYTSEYWLFMVNLVLSPLGVFFLLLVIGRCIRPKLFLDEFSADLWAAQQLKNVLKVEDASNVLRKFFEEADKYLKNKSEKPTKKSFRMCFAEAIESIIDPHPSNEERVENIKNLGERNVSSG